MVNKSMDEPPIFTQFFIRLLEFDAKLNEQEDQSMRVRKTTLFSQLNGRKISIQAKLAYAFLET